MDSSTAPPVPSRAIGPIAVVAATATVLGVASFLVRGAPFEEVFKAWIFHNAPLGALLSIGMAAALRRDPTNRAARFLFASSVAAAVHVTAVSVTYALFEQYPAVGVPLLAGDPVRGADVPTVVAIPLWISTWTWVVAAGLAMVWGLPLAPDGRWPSPRWRWLEAVGGVGVAAFTLAWAWGLVPLEGRVLRLNEFTAHGVLGQTLFLAGGLLLGVAALGSVTAVLTRLWHTDRGGDRTPRWVAAVILMFPLTMVLLYPWQELWAVVNAVSIILLIATLTIAITRHGLFDVEVIVGRAVTAALLAAFVTLAYVGIVVGIGWLLGARDNLALALGATAVIAVAFEPLRRWTTTWVKRAILGVRTTPADVLAALSDRLARADSTDDVLSRVVDLLVAGSGGVAAEVRVPSDGEGAAVEWEVIASTGPAPSGGVAHAAAVVNEGECLGQVRLFAEREDHLSPGDDRLLRQVAGTVGPVLRNAALTRELTRHIAELRASRERLVMAEDHARRSVERDIHDGAQQQLLALRLKLGLAETLAESRDGLGVDGRLSEVLHHAAADTDEAIRALRRLARGLYPPILEQEGLGPALRSHLRDVPLDTDIAVDGVGRHPPGVETAVYFCCLEAIQNATKHAAATRLRVSLDVEGAAEDEVLTFNVTDDGRGFDSDNAARGSGLANMTDRIEAMGGTLTVRSGPDGGTEVRGCVPLAREGLPLQDPASAR